MRQKSYLRQCLYWKIFSPKSALVGDEVTFTGSGFGDYRADADSHVSFNGTEVTQFVKYSDKRIVVKVPEGATSGNVTLKINNTELVTEDAFTVKEPEPEVTELLVTGFSPMEDMLLTKLLFRDIISVLR